MDSQMRSRYPVVIGISIISLIIYYLKDTSTFFAERLGFAFGSTMMSVLLAYVIAIPISSNAKDNFRTVFAVTWVILTLVILIGSSEQVSTTNSKAVIPKGYKYAPLKAPFEVTFTNKPNIRQTSSVIESGDRLNNEVAEYDKRGILERTEFGFSPLYSSSFTQEQIYSIFESYAKMNGLNQPEMSYERINNAATGQMRAYKDFKGIPFVLTMKVYVLDSCSFSMLVGAPAKKYPTKETDSFLNSVVLK